MNFDRPKSINPITTLAGQGISALGVVSSVVAMGAMATTGLGVAALPLAALSGLYHAAGFVSATKAAEIRGINNQEIADYKAAQARGEEPPIKLSEHLDTTKQVPAFVTKTAKLGALLTIGAAVLMGAVPLMGLAVSSVAAPLGASHLAMVAGCAASAISGVLVMRNANVAEDARNYAHSDAATKERDHVAKQLEAQQERSVAREQAVERAPQMQASAQLGEGTQRRTDWVQRIKAEAQGTQLEAAR